MRNGSQCDGNGNVEDFPRSSASRRGLRDHMPYEFMTMIMVSCDKRA